MIKRLLASAAVAALPLGLALIAAPAQAVTGDECGDGAGWDWKISNPARYQAGNHEAVVGLSEANRTVTILAPAGCTFDVGDDWRVYNGYFSAEGTITQAEIDAGDVTSDSDNISVEVPISNSVAGDDIGVHLKVNDQDAPTPGWEVDKYSSVAPLNLLRRTLFVYRTSDNRINFSEPYVCDEPIRSGGFLVRVSWSDFSYAGYAGRTVKAESRPDPGIYGTIVDTVQTSDSPAGQVRFSFTVDEAGGPSCGDTFVVRARYGGNGTSSGNWSTGDRIAAAG